MNFRRFLIFFFIIMMGFSASTQWVASEFQYSEHLGHPLFNIGEAKLYQPFSSMRWMITFGEYYPLEFNIAGGIIVLSVIFGFIFLVISTLREGKKVNKQSMESMPYGTAKWANESEMHDAKLYPNRGVILGIDEKGQYIRDDSDRHIKVFAPTRSGKGVGIVVPSLFTWPESVVVFDPKGENYNITSGYRSRFSDVYYFNPTDRHSAKFNPLLEVRKGDNEVKDAQNIADMTVDPDGKGLTDHWARTSHSLLVGAILHVLYCEKRKCLAGVADLLSNPKMTIEETLEMMMASSHYEDGSTHEVVARTARDMLNKSFEERSGVLSTAMAHLTLYRDPILATATERSDFRIEDFVDGKRPKSLYIVIPGSDISRLRPLFRLIINQFCKRLTESLNYEETIPQSEGVLSDIKDMAVSLLSSSEPKTEYKLKPRNHKLLLLMDEFPVLGKLEFFETSLAYMAQYGLKAMLISQSKNQLVKEYSEHNSIVDNCHIRIFHAPNTIETAELISKMLGQMTAKNKHKNYGGNRFGVVLGHVTEAEQQTGRPLLTPGEVLNLDKDKEIIFVTNVSPILCKKLAYYNDKNLSVRKIVPPLAANLEITYENAGHDWTSKATDTEKGINDLFDFDARETIDPQAELPFFVTGKRRKPQSGSDKELNPDSKFLLGDD